MQKTINYGLNKPDKEDYYNIEDFNANADVIDTKLKELEESSNTTNAGLASHTKSKSNPHGVTKSQIGLGNVDNTSDANKPISTATQAELDKKALASDLTTHTSNKSNPHGVTKSQVGLSNVPNVSTNDQTPTYTEATSNTALVSGEKLSVAFGKIAKSVSSLISHLSNTGNPHSVTATQVGLGNVPNVTTNNQAPTFTMASSNADLTSGEVLSTSFGKIARAINSLRVHLADNVSHITSDERTTWNNKLDATATAVNTDKLDGYHANDFVFLNNFIGGNLGSKAKYYSAVMEKDCNDIDEFIVLASGADGLHYPTAGGFWYILTLKYSETERKQIALDYVGNKVQVRYEKSGVWYDWVPLALLSDVPSVRIQETAPTDTSALWVW